jgi:uncharacterized cupredoxin-like copper-binding protein
MNRLNKTLAILAMSTTLSALPVLALAAGGHGAPDAMQHGAMPAADHPMAEMADMDHAMHGSTAGVAGDPAKVDRTVTVQMGDSMRFTPDKLSVKAGETLRFFIVNKGRMAHEMVIGTADEITEHAAMMQQMPGMVHDEANQIRLAPGQRGGIVWQFTQAGMVSFACLVPGHREAGMVGMVEVN